MLMTTQAMLISNHKKFLFHSSGECESITGGWSTYPIPSGYLYGALNKRTVTGDYYIRPMTQSQTKRCVVFGTKNTVDLTLYKRLKIKRENKTAYAIERWFLSSAKGYEGSPKLEFSPAEAGEKILTIDISLVTGSWYIGAFMSTELTTTIVDSVIYNVWLEK